MGRGYFIGKPWYNTIDWCTFQIGQCRLHVHLKKIKEFYVTQPSIIENCPCCDCRYFETVVIHQPNRLFEILKKMEVDLGRQPNIIPGGISCVGDTKPDKLGYIGNYFVFGQIGKTSKKTIQVNEDCSVHEVTFNNMEFGDNTQVTIKQVDLDKISFEFYMDVHKSPEFERNYIDKHKGCS